MLTTSQLREAFRDLSEDNAQLMISLWAARKRSEKLAELVERVPQTAAYVRKMHSSPYDSAMWRRTVALHALDALLGTHGVECLRSDDDGCTDPPAFEYLNAGDPYVTTLIFDRAADELTIGCWGDVVEAMERDTEADDLAGDYWGAS